MANESLNTGAEWEVSMSGSEESNADNTEGGQDAFLLVLMHYHIQLSTDLA
ncbi:hypothetical protein PISMIDRAFT_18163 [Pisolithus microcarpus 441]|uniref:Uncharacterized protein n=1 Tax=Pisolithus microcarpus 441 TaxID=765257 RepID=A0A0C9XLI0_9AGAM|nr:hypothetical protein PISMIDRAFT_18163 [Pisolithus microcarpus 441]